MARVLVVGAFAYSLVNFRGELIRALVGDGHEVVAMAAPTEESIVRDLERLGARFRAFPVQRNSVSPLADLGTLLSLRKAFIELEPDAILAYTIKPVIWGGLAARTLSGPRFHALIAGLGFAFQGGGPMRCSLTWLVTVLYRMALRRAVTVTFQNPDNRDEFVARGIVPPERCFVVNGSGVDLDRFASAPIPQDGTVFLCIARLLGEKGLREYAQAAAMVKARHPDVLFRLVGPPDPSPDRVPLQEVRGWQDTGWIDYRGEAKDVRPFLAGCHVYVLPSYHEGMPRSVLEAMATGRPILTTDVPGCRETVVAGENGFLVPKGDADALAERMCWFIENRGSWDAMGRRSRSLAEERFDVRKVNDWFMQALGVAGRRPTGL